MRFRDDPIAVRLADLDELAQYDVVFFAGTEDASSRFVPRLEGSGCVVIDNSPAYRLRPDLALVIPEINGGAVAPSQRVFPVANCTAILLCTALAPIRDAAGLRGVRVATYQAVSGAGRAALEAFDRGTGEFAANVVPQIGGEPDRDGYTAEERKVRDETRKMLSLPALRVECTCVRVPVRSAHSEAIFVETERSTSVDALAEALASSPSVAFHRAGIATPRDAEGSDLVHVARLRAIGDCEFSLWCTGDQLRKGAATTAVQILELVLARGWVR